MLDIHLLIFAHAIAFLKSKSLTPIVNNTIAIQRFPQKIARKMINRLKTGRYKNSARKILNQFMNESI